VKVVIAGGSGFLGAALTSALRSRGDQVTVLSRRGQNAWTPDGGTGPWARVIDGADAIVNLAGEPLPDKRWTAAQKARILESRVRATRSLVEAIRAAALKPQVLISSSGVGIYPDSDAIVDETAAPGSGFLSRVCVEWESEALRAAESGCRVVLLRTGVVLHRDGGALAKLLLPFSLGLGGPIGSGTQWWGWIHRDDWVRMAVWALDTAGVSGPLNVCAPEPAMNRDVMRALGRALNRPAVLPTPAFALRLALGEMAGEMLLASQRAVPAAASARAFAWQFPELQRAMDDAVRPVRK
jgi:uncharacterized protein (TIGR01777 family)